MIKLILAFARATKHSSIFLIEFIYHVLLLNDVKDKKELILRTVISYFLVMWLVERIQM